MVLLALDRIAHLKDGRWVTRGEIWQPEPEEPDWSRFDDVQVRTWGGGFRGTQRAWEQRKWDMREWMA